MPLSDSKVIGRLRVAQERAFGVGRGPSIDGLGGLPRHSVDRWVCLAGDGRLGAKRLRVLVNLAERPGRDARIGATVGVERDRGLRVRDKGPKPVFSENVPTTLERKGHHGRSAETGALLVLSERVR